MTFPFIFILFKILLCSTFILVVVNIIIINMNYFMYFITNISCNTNYSNYYYCDYYYFNISLIIVIIAIFMIIIIIIVIIKSLFIIAIVI